MLVLQGRCERPDPTVSCLTLTRVQIDDEEPFEAYTYGGYWNGWTMPLFTREQADAITFRYRDIVYDAAVDSFTQPAPPGEEAEGSRFYGAVQVGGVKYYGIGAGYWIWDDLSDFEKDEEQALIEEAIAGPNPAKTTAEGGYHG